MIVRVKKRNINQLGVCNDFKIFVEICIFVGKIIFLQCVNKSCNGQFYLFLGCGGVGMGFGVIGGISVGGRVDFGSGVGVLLGCGVGVIVLYIGVL